MTMIEQVLDKARKRADAAEAFAVESLDRDVVFEAGKLKSTDRITSAGVALRIVKDGRLGFAATTDPSRANDVVDKALAAARFGKRVGYAFPKQADVPRVDTVDPRIEEYGTDAAVAEGCRAVEALRDRCPDALTDVDISASVTTARIMNTAGLDLSCRYTDFSHDITVTVVEGDTILWVSDGGDYGTLDIRTDQYVRHIADLVGKAKRHAPRITGDLPVIVTARELTNLLEAIEMGVDGLRMVKGESPLIGRQGEKILGGITLTDDPLVPFAPGSRPFDDEGTPSRRTVLFRDGIFESFLFDLDAAADAGLATTGNASRGLSVPEISISNLVMSTGDSSLEEMIADTREGVIVYEMLGGGQSNLLAGDFAVNLMLGFLVRDGEIAGRLTDTMVSGNVYEAFPRIDLAVREARQIGSTIVPDVRFSALSVTGR